jgi:hypothetical protein
VLLISALFSALIFLEIVMVKSSPLYMRAIDVSRLCPRSN